MLRGSRLFKLGAAVVIAIGFVIGLALAAQPIAQARSFRRNAAPQAPATSIVVNSLADTSGPCAITGTGTCTLRDAIAYANNTAGADTINFSVSGIISLTSGLVITDDVTIDGSGQAITVNGNYAVAVLDIINSGTNVTLNALTIANGAQGIGNGGVLTITHSAIENNYKVAGVNGRGAGIDNNGTLNISNSDVSGNEVQLGWGGGIFNDGGTVTISNTTFNGNRARFSTDNNFGGAIYNNGGTLTISDSSFDQNYSYKDGGSLYNNGGVMIVSNSTISQSNAIYGAGIFNQTGSTLTVSNSTFSGNSASAFGGAISNEGTLTVINSTFSRNTASNNGGAINNNLNSILVITNSTFSGNSASDGSAFDNIGSVTVDNSTFSGNSGPAILNSSISTVTLLNSIVANNSGGNCDNGGGAFTADAYNLADDPSCGSATQKTSAQIDLGALADNGGGTPTFALLFGSAAIDAGNDAVCPATDQRGVTRPQGRHCDVGAYEYNGVVHYLFLPLIRR